MRILVVGATGESLPPPYAGIPKSVLLRAAEWKKLGHTVAVLFVHRQAQEDDLGAGAEYFFEYEAAPTPRQKLKFLWHYAWSRPTLYGRLWWAYWRATHLARCATWLYAAYGVKLAALYKKWQPDIIVAEASNIKTWMAAEVARRQHRPIVFETYAEIHDTSMDIGPLLTPQRRAAYWRDFLSKAARIIAPSYFCAQGPLQYVAADKVEVIYHGIDLRLYKRAVPEAPRELKKFFGLGENSFVVGAVGAFTYRKGHDHIIQAAARLIRQGLPVEVALCGPGDQEKWRALAEAEGISAAVHFYSKLSDDDLLRLYKAMDLYVDASNTPRACLGMSLTEAEATGLPCVAYDNGGLAEVVHDGENGFVVPLDDIPALAAGMEKVWQAPLAVRRAWGENSKKISELVNITRAAARRAELFAAVLAAYTAVKGK